MLKKPNKIIWCILKILVLTILVSINLYPCSFSLYTESNGYSIGNFASGVAAEAKDASTAWYNPAGLVNLKKQEILVSGVGVVPFMSLSGNTSFITPGFSPYKQQFSELEGAETGLIPAVYYSLPIDEQSTFALSFTVPFGLSTAWDPKSPLRYGGTYSKLLTIDLAPNIGRKINDNLSAGFGLDFQYAKVNFDSVVGSPAQLDTISDPTLFDSLSENHGDSFGVGFHAGILYQSSDHKNRYGINYQSQTKHKFKGQSVLSGILASDGLVDPTAVFETSIWTNNISFPNILTISSYNQIDDKKAVLFSIVWTGWGVFNTIQLFNVAGLYPTTQDVAAIENYHDAWRFGVGFNYYWNENLTFRTGLGYDETPTNNTDRDIRIPDASRFALGLGGTYTWGERFAADLGFSFMHSIDSAKINKISDAGGGSSFYVNALGSPYVYLIGGGLHGFF